MQRFVWISYQIFMLFIYICLLILRQKKAVTSHLIQFVYQIAWQTHETENHVLHHFLFTGQAVLVIVSAVLSSLFVSRDLCWVYPERNIIHYINTIFTSFFFAPFKEWNHANLILTGMAEIVWAIDCLNWQLPTKTQIQPSRQMSFVKLLRNTTHTS